MTFILLAILHGPLSYYAPGDGCYNCSGILACGGEFKADSNHVAIRSLRDWGCGREVIVCSYETNICAHSKLLDAGPYGIVKGKKWRVAKGKRAPEGWQFRARFDLSYRLWVMLGKPAFLSNVMVIVL